MRRLLSIFLIFVIVSSCQSTSALKEQRELKRLVELKTGKKSDVKIWRQAVFLLKEVKRAGRCVTFSEIWAKMDKHDGAELSLASFELRDAGLITRSVDKQTDTAYFGLPEYGPCF